MSANEEFCSDCPDREACMTGFTCEQVKGIAEQMKHRVSDTREQIQDEPDVDRLRDALTDWWVSKAQDEVHQVAPKAIEYGATDLAEIGKTMGLIMGRTNLSHGEATEIGIYFYVVGKLARWTDAIKTGRRVSDDTLHDMGVYIKMEQRNRDVGGWPFAPGEEH